MICDIALMICDMSTGKTRRKGLAVASDPICARELRINPQRIVAAGGHVAACTHVIAGHEAPGEDTSISSVPYAMILMNPVIDTTAKGYGLGKVGEDRLLQRDETWRRQNTLELGG